MDPAMGIAMRIATAFAMSAAIPTAMRCATIAAMGLFSRSEAIAMHLANEADAEIACRHSDNAAR